MTVSMPWDFVGYLVVAELAAIAAVIAVAAPTAWLAKRLHARNERILREREGRRDGYVTEDDEAEGQAVGRALLLGEDDDQDRRTS